MHEYRRFIQGELDARGWDAAELVRRSGLRRQLVWKILHDDRPTLGQMPDETTLQRLANGLSIPVDWVRLSAARSLRGYEDDGAPVGTNLTDVSIDALLLEIRRRVEEPHSTRRIRINAAEDESQEFPLAPFGDDPGEMPGEDRRQHGQ